MPAREPAPAVPPSPSAGGDATPSFESAMERLETLVEQMENARLPLEELIRSYEEGTQLIKVCNERLSAAEQRIEIITRDAAGQVRAAEFTTPPAAAPPAPKSSSSSREPKAAQETPPASSTRPSKNPNEVSLF